MILSFESQSSNSVVYLFIYFYCVTEFKLLTVGGGEELYVLLNAFPPSQTRVIFFFHRGLNRLSLKSYSFNLHRKC